MNARHGVIKIMPNGHSIYQLCSLIVSSHGPMVLPRAEHFSNYDENALIARIRSNFRGVSFWLRLSYTSTTHSTSLSSHIFRLEHLRIYFVFKCHKFNGNFLIIVHASRPFFPKPKNVFGLETKPKSQKLVELTRF